ncbi:MAG: hypothetical protein OET44_20490, partial [Gammaproteobacteria bacterium]|nr:hypothetical protein [Gammaproteobacteria bacterium]
YSVHFGANKINMHGPEAWRDAAFTLRGPTAVPGCGDICFVWNSSEAALTRLLADADAQVIEGPVERIGGREDGAASGTSIYVRDPDSNLLEFIVYPDS